MSLLITATVPTAALAATTTDLRVGVLALANAIAAVGRAPELAEPLPFTRTSPADVLRLDDVVTQDLIDAMADDDLEAALAEVPGIIDVTAEDTSAGQRLTFSYQQDTQVPLPLAYDDGNLRLGTNDGAGQLSVALATNGGTPFVVEVDESEPDPLLRFALVSEPELDLTISISTPALTPFGARQGFTEVDLTDGHYAIDRAAHITLRDPNGRGRLTLEDLRYSTLVDLFRVVRGTDVVDIGFDVALPGDVAGGTSAQRIGTLTLQGTVPPPLVWPDPADAVAAYGDALTAVTGLSLIDGMTALARYTGSALVLADSADVRFPNVGGGITDLFAPADDLLALLTTGGIAQIRCGLTPTSPPAGTAMPGDVVYCDAVPAAGLGAVTSAVWTVNDAGNLTATPEEQLAAVGAHPAGTVPIVGSDGEPDVSVDLTFEDGSTFTARSLPRTVQDVVGRITELGAGPDRTAAASAAVDLAAGRLDLAVSLAAQHASADLSVGDPATLGTLVGLTGLESGSARATVRASDATFDVGFGIPLGDGPVVLLPADDTLVEVGAVSADPPVGLANLRGRIGFLGVDVDVSELTLGADPSSAPVVSLTADHGTAPIAVDDLLTDDGTLQPGQVSMTSRLVGSIRFAAHELPIVEGAYATGAGGPASGTATVVWDVAGFPTVVTDSGYDDLRIFDPVPAIFVVGTAQVVTSTEDVTPPDGGDPVTVDDDQVTIEVADTDLLDALGLPADSVDIEVARRLLAPGAGCLNVLVKDAHTLTCSGLAPDGTSAFAGGETVPLIFLGDPFALRDGIIEGLSQTLNDIQRLDADNRDEGLVDDQYTATLPLVDLRPAQLAVERDALASGMADLIAAADEDTGGAAGGSYPPVSSAQELAANVGSLVEGGIVGYLLGDVLSVTLGAPAPDGTTLQAPLRFFVDGTGQVVSDDSVTVAVTSATTLATDIDTATARPGRSALTSAVSHATLDRTWDQDSAADDVALRAGAGTLTATGGSAALDVTVVTSYDPGADTITTTRTGADLDGSGHSALADLIVVERAEHLVYTGFATDSSGGDGAAQPAPEPMQVRFLAEGLDGLASALDGGLDGNSLRVMGEGGVPVAAPLIGANLDAGADVAGVLTNLTSSLRDELELITAATATDLQPALVAAATAALAATDGVSGTAPVATVDCGGPCAADAGPTVWETLSIHTSLTSDDKVGEAPFDVGLAGLNVRSDQMIETRSRWTLPITIELARGVGPQVAIADGDTLRLEVSARLPDLSKLDKDVLGEDLSDATCTETRCLPAILGYLPGMLRADDLGGGAMATTVVVAPTSGDHDLFALYDGIDVATSFDDDGRGETGLTLGFETVASEFGSFDLEGRINVPWTAADGFGEVTYTDVKLDVGEVIATLATPFAAADPYLGPVRDIIDFLRTPIPVVTDLSQMAGGNEVSLLGIVDTMKDGESKLALILRTIGFVEAAVNLVDAIAPYAERDVPLEDLSASGALLTVDPDQLLVAGSCKETTRKTTTSDAGTKTKTKTKAPCEPPPDEKKKGPRNQTTGEKRKGDRNTKQSVARSTKTLTGPVPGFSLPFLADPNQIIDVLTGEGEATYFRLDFGTLAVDVAYSVKFGPFMAGPVPLVAFVGGSIGLQGRLAIGFDSQPQTRAVEELSHPGDIAGLMGNMRKFYNSNLIFEGLYLDDLDAEGTDVPEIKIVTTIEAGAGVSIGLVTAGIKGGITVTINLDLNDPNDDGKIRFAEIRDMFAGDLACVFDVSSDLVAFLKLFFEIDLLLDRIYYDYTLVRLGPFELFDYGCEDAEPVLVIGEDGDLALTSGSRSTHRPPAFRAIAERYEIRQFDEGGGAAADGTTTFEISALRRVQRVTITPQTEGDAYDVTIYNVAVAVGAEIQEQFTITSVPSLRFLADGGARDDRFSFLRGERFDDEGELVSTPFTTPVTLDGGLGDDVIVTGDANDHVFGGLGGDSISAGLGDDWVDGSHDDDIIDGGPGNDDLFGGYGNDQLQGGPGADRLQGGAGDDGLTGGPGRDVRALLLEGVEQSVEEQVLLGFDSGDVLIGGGGADTVDGGDGSDVVVGGGAPGLGGGSWPSLLATTTRTVNVLTQVREIVGRGIDVPTAPVPSADLLDILCASGAPEGGGATTDRVTGGPEADIVIGGNGADDLDGGGGPDELCGRAGDDTLMGDGASRVQDAGSDVMRGGHGSDRLIAGPGDDIVFGDDVVLYRDGVRVLDGSLGGVTYSSGAGDDYLAGEDGDDVLAGGAGSDLLLAGAGDDQVFGEGRDTAAVGGDRPPLDERLIDCQLTTRVVGGYVDLNGDLLAGPTDLDDVAPDDGRLAGLSVVDGVIHAPDGPFTGLLSGEVVVIDGLVDLDRDGTSDSADTGLIGFASMLATAGGNVDGDCVLGEAGDDLLLGGSGSDYVGGGDGTDLVDGGDGNDLLLGDAGTDVLLGGPHDDVVVGGDGDDHLQGGSGDDRLRGNEGDDDLVGGTTTAGDDGGRDLLLGGRGEDVLAGDEAILVSAAIVDAVVAAPWHAETIVPVAARALDGSPLRFEDSAVACGADAATRWVTLLESAATAGDDELYGGYGCDWAFGQVGDDLVRGGQDDDVVEAGPGSDTAYGDAGDDVVVGGSSVDPSSDGRVVVARSGAGVSDGDDTLLGDGGPDGLVGDDLLIGDNGTPVRQASMVAVVLARFGLATGAAYNIMLADVPAPRFPPAAGTFGADTIYAGGGSDLVFGQAGNDIVDGGGDDDYVEGNAGDDVVRGGAGDDDLIGGSSTNGAWPLGIDGQRLMEPLDRDADPTGLVDASAAGVVDGRDLLLGEDGDDVVLGDNGRITRPGGTLTSSTSVQPVRDVAMADLVPGPTSGSDTLRGGAGDDVLYGQLDDTTVSSGLGSGDEMHGGAGSDVLVADLAVVILTPAEALGDAETLTLAKLGIVEDVYAPGTLVPVTWVPASAAETGGADIAYGDAGDDVLRMGAGADLANGGTGQDVVLGGAGDDALWGGPDHDRLFGGYGDDDLDLKPRAADPPLYATVAPGVDTDGDPMTVNGADLIYGGWGADELQADVGGAGPDEAADHLLDWVGVHNVYYVCGGAYGVGRVIRQSSPAAVRLLTELVVAAGGTAVDVTGSGDWLDLGLVRSSDNSANSAPSPEAPGNYTCEGAGP